MQSRTRQAIVEAARKLFSTWGYDRASMDAIAAEARVTKVTVYRHFENKDALFSARFKAFSMRCRRRKVSSFKSKDHSVTA